MGQAVEFALEDGGTLLVEVNEPEPEAGTVRAGRGTGGGASEAAQTFDAAIARIRPVVDSIIAKLRDLTARSNEIEVELGIKLNASGGVIIAGAG